MLDFRELTELCIPTGPSFSSAEDICITASGNIIKLKTPKHKPSLNLYKEIKNLDIDITTEQDFKDIPNSPKSRSQKYKHILCRNWAFKGPIFTGYVAEIFFCLNIYKSLDHKNEGKSLFIEKNFEKLILDDLTNDFGEDIDDDEFFAEWIAPLNWHINSSLDTPSITLDILPYEECPHPHKKRLYAVISDDCYIVLNASMHQSIPGSIKEKDTLIDRKSMIDLTDHIFSSISIELSELSKKQQQDALLSNSFSAFSSDIKPLKWTTDEQDKKHEEAKKEIAYFKSLATKSN